MKKLRAAAIALVLAQLASASTLYYGGDPDGFSALVSGASWNTPLNPTSQNISWLYDDFVVPSGGWTITALGGNFVTEVPTAYWLEYHIRTGVSEGSPGTLVAFGYDVPTVTPNGFDFGQQTGFYVELTFPLTNFDVIELPPGTYWLSLFWHNYIVVPGAIPYITTTSGANAVGGPFSNRSYWHAPDFGLEYIDPAPLLGLENVDFSYRISGTLEITATPEPRMWLLIGTSLGLLRASKRKPAQARS